MDHHTYLGREFSQQVLSAVDVKPLDMGVMFRLCDGVRSGLQDLGFTLEDA